MKVTILGAGVIGVTTAYVLGARGFEVEVIERQAAPASETSFANGGQLSFSHAEPWANPSTLPLVFKWMFKKDAPLVFRFKPEWNAISWGLQFLRNCTSSCAYANSVSTLRLGLYSKKKMEQLRTISGVKFDNVREGILHVFSDQQVFDHAIEQAHFQEKFGCRENVLTVEECVRMEPALEHAGRPLVGGIHAPLDESGDICAFTRELAAVCEREFGAVFHYNQKVLTLNQQNGRVVSVTTDKGEFKADSFVMALGSYAPVHLRPLGIRIPVYPMKGYSITLPANIYTPTVSLTDGENKLVYSRLGDRLRVAGTAEFAGYNDEVTPHRIDAIVRAVKRLLPRLELDHIGLKWACLRPQTPDGPPIIGKTPVSNLYLNTGHGTLGWTQAAGSAFLLADIIENRPTEIAPTGLTLERCGRSWF